MCLYIPDLSDIRYRFTSCGVTGRSGPNFLMCHQYYTEINSPIAQQDLLFEIDSREHRGAQGFQVPKNGLYNITVAAAGGGRGICNFEHGGSGYQRTVQVDLSTEYELLVLVGQRGTGPCDVIPKNDEIYDVICKIPPTNVSDIEKCNETWYNFTRGYDHFFYEVFGGGAGGGGTLVRARNRNTGILDEFPIVIVGGGGGTASVLDYDVVEEIDVQNTLLDNRLSYRTFIDGLSRTHQQDYGLVGTQGYRIASKNMVSGAGGGYRLSLLQRDLNTDGRALDGEATGGLDCTQIFIAVGSNIPYSCLLYTSDAADE